MIGFIGLGVMGGRMASRLLGVDGGLVVHDAREAAMRPLVERGAIAAGSPAELAGQADLVCVSLPAPGDVKTVLDGPGGILRAARPGLVVVDLSTTGPAAARALAERAEREQVSMLDAPVAGGAPEAESGTLLLMVGGSERALERALPTLLRIGRAVFHFGGSGTGQAAKLSLNLAYGGLVAGAAEGAGLFRRLGGDLGTFVKLLEAVDANPWFRRPARDALAGSFEPGFRVELLLKDLGLAAAAGEAAGVKLPIAEAVRARFADARDRGFGELHTSAAVRLYTREGDPS